MLPTWLVRIVQFLTLLGFASLVLAGIVGAYESGAVHTILPKTVSGLREFMNLNSKNGIFDLSDRPMGTVDDKVSYEVYPGLVIRKPMLAAGLKPVLPLVGPQVVPPPPSPTPDVPAGPGIYAGERLFVDPGSRPRKQAEEWRHSRPQDAALMDLLASQPTADWFGDWNMNIYQDVKSRVDMIYANGALPVLVIYHIPLRDLNSYSAGGARSPEAYRTWIQEFARGVGNRKAIVILEPDALGHLGLMSETEQAIRLKLLNDAVDILTSQGSIQVYLDVGHSAWLSVQEAESRLKKAGVARCRGFAINVSNFQTDAHCIRYGKAISSKLGRKNFVIDTSRNGAGPPSDQQNVINPPGRSVGRPPSVATGIAELDAYLWIKRPGESDGNFNGGPPAGQWWPEGALDLLKRVDRVSFESARGGE